MSNCRLSLPSELSNSYKLSEYNIYLKYGKGLVYNTITQAIAEFNEKEIKSDDLPFLLENGFVVFKNDNELKRLNSEYENREIFSENFHLIIALTLDCQFRCVYCYENHPKKYMNQEIKSQVINLVKREAVRGKNISIVWYGGEPLLDFNSIASLTKEFIEICNKYNVTYCASMISNGYLFNNNIIDSLKTLHIDSVQITLDGMNEIHEKRRPLMNKKKSFDRIIKNIIDIYNSKYTKIHLRINVDKSNIQSAYELIEYLSIKKLYDIDINLGLMKKFGCDHNGFKLEKNLFSMKEFSDEFLKFRDKLVEFGFKKATEKMIPEYKINSCTMDAPNSYVIDPDGYVYKCISYVGQKEHSIGTVGDGFNKYAHLLYNPFKFDICKKCTFFPICKGGCLINNIDGVKECNIWRFITEDLILREIKEI